MEVMYQAIKKHIKIVFIKAKEMDYYYERN